MIIFHNPHSWVFWKTIYNYLKWIKHPGKYKYLIQYALENNIKFWAYIRNPSKFPKIFTIIVFYTWCILNKVKLSNIKIFYKIKDFNKDENNYLFTFIWRLDDDQFVEENINTKMIIWITHFFMNIEKFSNNLKKIQNYYLCWEANSSKNSTLFKKYFSFYDKDFFILPFTYQKRFQKFNDFKNRKLKCFAIGALLQNNPFDNELKKFYWKDYYGLHPMRKFIYENQEKMKNEIESYISLVYDKWFKKKDVKKYYSFDIVEKYNEYAMFAAPEEIVWLPTISMVEWMACWCAYIWQEWPIYTDVWMVSWIHYIWYDWTLNWLIEKIKYYQKHTHELEKIANNGYMFAISNFNEYVVAKKFFDKFNS